MIQLTDFRRLCVKYGEARVQARRTNMPEDYTEEWKKECERLWGKIENEERWLLDMLLASPTYLAEQEKDLWRKF